MRKLSIALFSLMTCLQSSAQNDPNWMRYSAISPDGKTIAFTYKGDIYKVPSSVGTATMLTLHEANDLMPIWSKDGKHIAFASDRHGDFDVFLVAAEGGEPKRLTYHSVPEFPYSFTADNKSILFGSTRQDAASNRTYPTGSQPELYKVSVNGGRVEQVLTTPAEWVNLSSNGQFMLYQDKK